MMRDASSHSFKPLLFITFVFAVLVLTGCGGAQVQVERMSVDEAIDLSGAWNDTDSRLVSEEMIQDMLSRAWLLNHARRTGEQPAIIVGGIRNLSHEHINVNTFVGDIERAMINSGQITFVASSSERKDIRDERADQDLHASDSSRKKMGQELGADFMLKGKINTIIDMEGRTQVRYYQVDLDLISLTDNRKVWLGQKKIKKLVKNSSMRF